MHHCVSVHETTLTWLVEAFLESTTFIFLVLNDTVAAEVMVMNADEAEKGEFWVTVTVAVELPTATVYPALEKLLFLSSRRIPSWAPEVAATSAFKDAA